MLSINQILLPIYYDQQPHKDTIKASTEATFFFFDKYAGAINRHGGLCVDLSVGKK